MAVVTELPGKQTRVYTRKCQVYLTDVQVALHDRALAASNKLHNYALTKLERRFGLAPGTRFRVFPTGKWLRLVLSEIRLAFARDEYGLTRWSWKAIGLSAQMAEAQLVKLATNFAMYRESAHSLMMAPAANQEKWSRIHGKPVWRRGSIQHIRPGDPGKQSITAPNDKSVFVLSNTTIKLPLIGLVQTCRDLSKVVKGEAKIRTITLKRVRGNKYELQMTFSETIAKVPIKSEVGLDWGMAGRTVFTSNSGRIIENDEAVVSRVVAIRNEISILQARMAKTKSERKVLRLKDKIRRLHAKASNVMTNEQRRIARAIADEYDLIVLERLNSSSMRRRGRGRAQSRGFNAKLAVVQPYSLTQAVIDAATSSGKTVILVDPYKTSRVEFETGYVHEAKISLSVRGWPSPVDGRWVDRDINAARNILSWGKSPSLHRRHIETGCDPLELVTVH